MSTKTTPKPTHREPLSETEALRVDLEQTRQHLADTVQELSRQFDVPRRIKESAGNAGRRLKATAGQAGSRMKDVPDQLKDLPAASLRHPKATAAVGGAVALGVGAAAWIARRNR